MPADTPHTRTALTRKEGDALTEDVALPALSKGLVYWVQPRWTDAAGQALAPAVIWELKSEPVEQASRACDQAPGRQSDGDPQLASDDEGSRR